MVGECACDSGESVLEGDGTCCEKLATSSMDLLLLLPQSSSGKGSSRLGTSQSATGRRSRSKSKDEAAEASTSRLLTVLQASRSRSCCLAETEEETLRPQSESTEKARLEKDGMAKEAMGKLSQLVRERDLEVEALKMRAASRRS